MPSQSTVNVLQFLAGVRSRRDIPARSHPPTLAQWIFLVSVLTLSPLPVQAQTVALGPIPQTDVSVAQPLLTAQSPRDLPRTSSPPATAPLAPPLPPRPEPPLPLEAPPLLGPEGPPEGTPATPVTGVIRQYRLEAPNPVFSQEEIDRVTAPFRDREISFVEALQAVNAITQLYLENGYITTGAYLPADAVITDGIVPVRVVEGVVEAKDIRVIFTKPDFKEEVRSRLSDEYIRTRLAIATQAPLNRQRLLEALQLLQINPLIQNIQAQLAEGPTPGQSILNVRVVEAPKSWQASLLLDNGRSPSVGSFRRQIQFTEGNLSSFFGDALRLSYTNTDGSNAGDLSYTVPVSPYDSTVQLNIGLSRGNIIETPFNELDIRSEASYLELSFRHPIIRKPSQELGLGVTLSYQYSKATLIDGEIPFPVLGSDFEGVTRSATLRFFQDWVQRSAQETLSLRSQFSFGLDILGATLNEVPPDGRFFAWRGQAQWVRILAPETFLLLRGDLQIADRALIPVEQFGLGGPQNVRGYRQDLILSDNGFFSSAEVRMPLLRVVSGSDPSGSGPPEGVLWLTPFLEVGTTWNNSGFPASSPNTLASAGLGLLFEWQQLLARIHWGASLVPIQQERKTLQEQGLYFSLGYSF